MRTGICVVVAFVLLGVPALAETPNGTLRVMLSSANPTGSWNGDLNVGGQILPTEVEAESAVAFGMVYEIRAGDRWGVETGIYFADFDFTLSAAGMSADFGSALAIPLTLGANYHIVSNDRVDLYVGPQVSYTLWGNLDTPVGAVEIDGSFGVGAVAGIDVVVGQSGWTFNFATRYLGAQLGDPTVEVDVNPLLAELGVGFRF